jgi:hypothetical protein
VYEVEREDTTSGGAGASGREIKEKKEHSSWNVLELGIIGQRVSSATISQSEHHHINTGRPMSLQNTSSSTSGGGKSGRVSSGSGAGASELKVGKNRHSVR